MKKNYLYLAVVASLLGGSAYAQHYPCAADEMYQRYKAQNPAIAEYERQMNEQIQAYMAAQASSLPVAMKTTAVHNDTDYYDIPVVVHVIHNYGAEYVKDSNIYVMIANLNDFYSMQNDLSGIIAPFRPYIGNAKIRFHLATIDPQGRPTTGITRRLSYLTAGGDDQAKMDLWSPRSYFNIWLENRIGMSPAAGTTLAYSTFPASAEANPYTDGVITGYSYINDRNTMEHEVGHYFNLLHPWSTNSAGPASGICGDDGVDDTPPTDGHFSTCDLYDTLCAASYYKIYTSTSGVADSFVNYPDTTNTQNVMDYSSCAHHMLTIGQVWRMRAALNSNIGGRDNLWDSSNLAATGALAPTPDLPPVTEFVTRASVTSSVITQFTFPDVNLFFTNKSWRDTITATSWSFSNNAVSPTLNHTGYSAINSAFPNRFAEPGWVDITLSATGNNSGTTTTTYPKAVFVADREGVDPRTGYIEEFAEGGSRDKWPFFNYYNNSFRWKLANTGLYDNASMMYDGFDTRTGIDLLKGTPGGDFDDLYSIPFNLSGFESGDCFLYFNYSGASRSSITTNINDSLIIEYSTDKKHSWTKLEVMTKNNLCNKGVVNVAYTPAVMSDWAQKAINIPVAARTSYVVFRFRYKPGTGYNTLQGTGNNFYLDRVGISAWGVNVSDVGMAANDVRIVPNPTHGDAWVVIKDAAATHADVYVTDVTGKMVYTTDVTLSSGTAKVTIPADAIRTSGVYFVQTVTGSQKNTKKLVVY